MKLNICMILYWPHYKSEMRLDPPIEICSYLRHFGHKITWVMWGSDPRESAYFYLNDIKVYTTPDIKYLPNNWPLADLLNLIPNTFRRMTIIRKILHREKFDLVFVRDFALDGIIAACNRKKNKIPFVFQLSNPLEYSWEIFREEIPKPLRFFNYIAITFHSFLVNKLLRKADLILAISKAHKEQLVMKGFAQSKILIYPSGVDIDSSVDVDSSNVRNRYQLEGYQTAIYIGSMAKVRHLDILIKAFRLVVMKKNTKLLMVGEGSDKINLRRMAVAVGLENRIVFVGQVPQKDIPSYIAAADIGISPVPPLPFFKMSSPIKLFEYMAMAKPVIANEEITEHWEVLTQSNAGLLVPYTPEAFAQAIMELLDSPGKLAEMGLRGREWIVKNRSFEVLARQTEARFFELLGKNK